MYIDKEEISKYICDKDVLASVKTEIILDKLNYLLSQDEELEFWNEIIDVVEEFLLIGEKEVYNYIIKKLFGKKSK